MGMSASQARFLQLTARKSDTEYQCQRINFERLELANRLTEASTIYNDKTSNRKYTFAFVDGNGQQSVDVTYKNYKNYMNKQLEGLTSSQQQFFLVSSSGNKIVVSNEEEITAMINNNRTPAEYDTEGNLIKEEGYKFTYDDFIIVDGLNDVDNFKSCLEQGIYYFATLSKTEETDEFGNSEEYTFNLHEIDSMGAINSVLDESDDAQAQAEYERVTSEVEQKDKKMQMELERLESQRNAIQTEMEAVEKVISDNVEKTFKIFA